MGKMRQKSADYIAEYMDDVDNSGRARGRSGVRADFTGRKARRGEAGARDGLSRAEGTGSAGKGAAGYSGRPERQKTARPRIFTLFFLWYKS